MAVCQVAMWTIVWFVMVATLRGVVSFCPSLCRCQEGDTPLTYCNNSHIDLVPIMLNPQLRELYLNHNKIRHVYSSFTVYQELRHLDVSNNLITDIGRKSFIMQKSLKTLLLQGNNIGQLGNLSFYGLSSLSLLNVSRNRLAEIHARTFLGLDKLATLDLSHNLISFLARDAFHSLFNLRQLWLCSNRLKSIPTHSFGHLHNLAQLDLSHNMFGHIGELAFSPLVRLESLSLSHCHINTINHLSLHHLGHLSVLNLAHNNLQRVPSDSVCELVSLKVLILSHNPISSLPPDSFVNLTHLQTLVISHTPLSSIDRTALRDNVNLVNLMLEHNSKLNSLHPDTLAAQQYSLRHLSLRSSRLSHLDAKLVNLQMLQHLDVSDNPLECNCSLAWLVAHLGGTNRTSSRPPLAQQIKCHTPARLKERKLITLSVSDLSCPQPGGWHPDVLTCSALAVLVIPLIILLVLLARTRAVCSRFMSTRQTPVVEHTHHMFKGSGRTPEPAYLDQHHRHHPPLPPPPPLYYPTIISEHNNNNKTSILANHATLSSNYQTMLTTSTRTSAISVDLYRPPCFAFPASDIANI